jgi:hypothetical protein
MVSELLQEAGLDRERARRLKRQILEGVIQMCRWQLERMDAGTRPPRGARKIVVD